MATHVEELETVFDNFVEYTDISTDPGVPDLCPRPPAGMQARMARILKQQTQMDVYLTALSEREPPISPAKSLGALDPHRGVRLAIGFRVKLRKKVVDILEAPNPIGGYILLGL